MLRVQIVQGPDAGKHFDVQNFPAVVGRGTDTAVTLTDGRVSRKHCELRLDGLTVEVADLGSGNGTLVNGKSIVLSQVRLGDRIALGDTILTLESPGSTLNNALGSGVRSAAEPPRVVIRAPEAASEVLRTVPADYGSQVLARPDAAGTDWLRSRLANLAVMYEATNAISEILDVDALLDRILELVLRTTDADHGCALVQDSETGELMPKAIRSRSNRGPAEFVVSRTVVDHVFRQRVGLLVADAAADERFRGGESIAKHQIREVICVPMTGRHDVVGVLFLDTLAPASGKTPTGQPIQFTEDHLRLAVAVAHQAALAIEETRYYQGMLQSERLAAVGQTIAALSHHIKNIMQGVRFGSDMVRMSFAQNDRELLTKGWRLVEKNQAKIDELILDMLNYSKEREPLLEPTNLAALVADVVEVVRGRTTEAGIAVEVMGFDSIPTVSCDPDGLHRALLNIVSNAVDALLDAPAKRLSIEASRADTGTVTIRIADSGPGISADKLKDIFKPFVSTKGARGTGLGLPVSRKILQEHGGDVTAENAPGGGAVFVLTLPQK
jgi:signal transduction histidine kinase